ncbi:MAG: sodium/sulfate symporter [Gammaproteobacteria bacterium]|nr:MAG: sodium/sulfate symporter [Gammaproteobacteria bacterium]TND01455.1 MAG: sodium/sulfate symporter [Gammaproteobacteria bacterium]
MSIEAWISIAVTGVALALLMVTRLGTDMVLMGALVILSVTGVLTPAEALGGFSNSGLITVALMYVIAAGISHTGGVDLVIDHVLKQPRTTTRALTRLMLPTIAVSGFINNTPVVAALIPAVVRWARRINMPVSHFLMPLSYAAILGGTLTMIGTSTNLVTNGQYQKLTGSEGFSMFDITPVGIAVALAGILYVILLGPRLLPSRDRVAESFANPREYTVEMAVAEDGPLVGKTIQEAGLRHLGTLYVVEIVRGDHVVTAVASEERLQGSDRLVFAGDIRAVLELQRIKGLLPSTEETPLLSRRAPERRIVEAVISPHSSAIGKTIRECRFRDQYGAVVIAVARNGERIEGNLASIRLSPADTLLLEARPAFVHRQQYNRDFLLISDTEEESPEHPKAWLAWTILLAIVLIAATGLVDMLQAAMIGAAAMIITRCCDAHTARRSLDMPVILSIAASFALGTALEKTGVAALLASQLLEFGNGNPWVMLALTYLMVTLLTEIITNNSAALLTLPIVLSMTTGGGLNPEPYVITVMMAASASFATPIGYQTNLMVYGPGGYRFSDFVKMGVPLNLLCGVVTVLVVPLIWPLTV